MIHAWRIVGRTDESSQVETHEERPPEAGMLPQVMG